MPPRAGSAARDQPAGGSHVAAVRVFRRVRGRFREGRADLSDADWRAWWRLMALATVGVFLLMVLLVVVAQRLLESGVLAWETPFLQQLSERGPFGFSTAVFYQAFGTDITLIILVTLTAGIAAWARRPLTALSLVGALVVVDLVVRFGWLIWSRARPAIVLGGATAPDLHAFPSGHTAKTMVVYGLLTVLWVRASRSRGERTFAVAILLFIAAVVPMGRLSMGAHWPSDVAAGMTLGVAYLGALAYGLRYERQ